MKIQVYLDGVVGSRLAELAAVEHRSVSAMAALLIGQALSEWDSREDHSSGTGGGHRTSKAPAVTRTPASRSESVELRVPPETPEPEPRAAVVEGLQRQVPGVSTASVAFPSVPQDLARQVTPRPRGGSAA